MNKIAWPLKDIELAELLGINPNTIRSHRNCLNKEGNLINEIDYVLEKNPRPKSSTDWRIWEWLEPGAIKVASRSGAAKAKDFLKARGIGNDKPLRIEHHCIDIIIASLENIAECTKNFPVISIIPTEKTYRIDLYLPKYKIAIECDETHHLTPAKKEADRRRQEKIEKNLDCYFIRFNPFENYFNIGNVINKIILRIMESISKI